jgi:antitoxin MazE
MKTRVQKWGNSLALRIPKSFAADAGLQEDSPVELTLAEGALIVKPTAAEPISLDELLRSVTDENIHSEWDTGRPVGNEAW